MDLWLQNNKATFNSYWTGYAKASSQRKSAPLCLHASAIKLRPSGSKFQQFPIAEILLGISAHANTLTVQCAHLSRNLLNK